MTTQAKSNQQSSSQKTSPIAIERYLKGVHYPTSKQDLVNHAKSQNAPSDVMHILERFTEHEYHSPVDVSKEVGKLQ